MKKLSLAVLAFTFSCGLSIAGPKLSVHKSAKGKTFSGEIMDSQCAMNGSHAQMEKMHNMPDDRKACTLDCVKMGGKFVLYDPVKKATYLLDDQEKPKEFAGQKVKVTGTYDKGAKVIKVETMQGT